MGVEATVIGFGRFGAGFGLGSATGTEPSAMVTTGSGFASAGLPAADFSDASGLASAFPLAFVSEVLPNTSVVVAAASSRAGMMIASSAGAGCFTGSLADFLSLGLACG